MTSNPLIRTGQLPEVLGGIDLAEPRNFSGGVPYELFARLRRQAPVLFHPHGPDPADGFWVLTRYADIAAAAADPAFSAQSGGGRTGGGTHLEDLPDGRPTGVLVFMMDDPRHEHIKRALHPFLSWPGIAALEPALRARAAELVGHAVASRRANIVRAIAEPFALHACCALLGVPERDRPRQATWTRAVVGFTDRRTGRVDDRSRASFAAMLRYFQGFVADKRAHPGDDLGSAIAVGTLPYGRPLSRVERDTHAAVLFVSGFEQSRNTIAAAVLAFAEHPEQWSALQTERSLLPGAVEEILRWAPPNPYNRRTATRHVLLHGQHIQAGDKVTFWWPSANRDPDAFVDPDVFDIRRDRNPHLAFGTGIHACSGSELGRLLLRLVLAALLDKVERIRLVAPVVYAPNNKHTVLLDVPVELAPAEGHR